MLFSNFMVYSCMIERNRARPVPAQARSQARVECKRVDALRLTPSMKAAVEELQLDPLAVIYPGSRPYPLADHIMAAPLEVLAAQGEAAFFQASGWRHLANQLASRLNPTLANFVSPARRRPCQYRYFDWA